MAEMWIIGFVVGCFLEFVACVIIGLNTFFYWWTYLYTPEWLAIPMSIIGIILGLMLFAAVGYGLIAGL